MGVKMLNLQSIYFGQKHPSFDYNDFDLIKKVQRLARKHHRQAENDCNGEGFVNGQHYYAGNIDDYVRREYGQNVKSAYVANSEETIFYKEINNIEAKIKSLLGISHIEAEDNEGGFMADKYRLQFQHDPRGATVKLYYEGDFIEL